MMSVFIICFYWYSFSKERCVLVAVVAWVEVAAVPIVVVVVATRRVATVVVAMVVPAGVVMVEIIIIMVIFRCCFSSEHIALSYKKWCEHRIRKNQQIKSTARDGKSYLK